MKDAFKSSFVYNNAHQIRSFAREYALYRHDYICTRIGWPIILNIQYGFVERKIIKLYTYVSSQG